MSSPVDRLYSLLPLRIWVQDPLKCSSWNLIVAVPQFSPQREHNQDQVLLFTRIKKVAISVLDWDFDQSPPLIPH